LRRRFKRSISKPWSEAALLKDESEGDLERGGPASGIGRIDGIDEALA
jgi:hypothetical protein